MLRKFLLSIFTITLAACALTVEMGKTFQLKYGASANLKDTSVKVTFQNVVDERCIVGPDCTDGGHATVTLKVENGESIKITSLQLAGNASATAQENIDNFEFNIANLLPFPEAQAGTSIPLKDYVIDVTIQPLASLTNHYWKLESIGYTANQPTPVLADTPYLLAFDVNAGVKGKKACNKLTGNYAAQANELQFSNIVSSLEECLHQDQESLDNQTAFFDSAINGATSYSTGSRSLKIISSDARELNFTGVKKREECVTATPGLPEDFNMCTIVCEASAKVNLSCFGPIVREQCNFICAIN